MGMGDLSDAFLDSVEEPDESALSQNMPKLLAPEEEEAVFGTIRHSMMSRLTSHDLLTPEEEMYWGRKKSEAYSGIVSCMASTPFLVPVLRGMMKRGAPYSIEELASFSERQWQAVQKMYEKGRSCSTGRKIAAIRQRLESPEAPTYLRRRVFEFADALKHHLESVNGDGVPEAFISGKDMQQLKSRFNESCNLYGAAFNQFFYHNQRLVLSISSSYSWQNNFSDLEDLFQEGNTGLVKAVHGFDYSRKVRFSTYATWWVTQAIQRYITDCGKTIRVPVHMNSIIKSFLKQRAFMAKKMGRAPTLAEVSEHMGMSEEKLRKVADAMQIGTVSIEAPSLMDNTKERGSLIPDESAEMPDERANEDDLKRAVGEALEVLTPQERRVIELRFGIERRNSETLESAGKKLRVTRERIRQIEEKALKKLRHPLRIKMLEPFLDET